MIILVKILKMYKLHSNIAALCTYASKSLVMEKKIVQPGAEGYQLHASSPDRLSMRLLQWRENERFKTLNMKFPPNPSANERARRGHFQKMT